MEQDGKEIAKWGERGVSEKYTITDETPTYVVDNTAEQLQKTVAQILDRLRKIELMLTEIGQRTIDGSAW